MIQIGDNDHPKKCIGFAKDNLARIAAVEIGARTETKLRIKMMNNIIIGQK